MGSRVIHGNLLVVPIENSILYVSPLYLRAESGQLPELKRIAAYGRPCGDGRDASSGSGRVVRGNRSGFPLPVPAGGIILRPRGPVGP